MSNGNGSSSSHIAAAAAKIQSDLWHLARFASGNSKVQRRLLQQRLIDACLTRTTEACAVLATAAAAEGTTDFKITHTAAATCLVQVYLTALLQQQQQQQQSSSGSSDTEEASHLWHGLVQAVTATKSRAALIQTAVTLADNESSPFLMSTFQAATKARPSLVGVALLQQMNHQRIIILKKRNQEKEENKEDKDKDNDDTEWITKVLLPYTCSAAWPANESAFDQVAGGILTVTPEQWTRDVSPKLQLAVKSSATAEKAWPVVRGWMQLVLSSAAAADQKGNAIATVAISEWRELVAKAVVDAKEDTTVNNNAPMAIMHLWIHHGAASSSPMGIADMVTPLLPTTTTATYSPAQRLHVYEALVSVAEAAQKSEKKNSIAAAVTSPKTLFATLAAWWKKETKLPSKRACLQAGLAWMLLLSLSSKQDETEFWATVGGKPADAGLVLQEICAAGWKKQTSTSSSPSKAAAAATESDKNSSCKIMLQALVDANPGMLKTWQGLTETAQTKRTAHLDGLLAIYAALLITSTTDNNNNNTKAPPSWVSKLMASASNTVSSTKPASAADAGGAGAAAGGKKNTSATPFLWQSSCWESTIASSGSMAGAALVQSLALYAQSMAAAETVKFWKGNASAAHAVAYTILFPGPMATPVTQAVVQLLQASATGGAWLVQACLQVSNHYSLNLVEAADAQANATRAARETISTTMTSVRPTFGLLRQIMTEHVLLSSSSPKGSTASKALPARQWTQGLILAHVGTKPSTRQGRQRQQLVTMTQQAVQLATGGSSVPNPDEVAKEILRWVTSQSQKEDSDNSKDDKEEMSPKYLPSSIAVHEAALSLLVSLGKVAGAYSPDVDEDDGEGGTDKKVAAWSHELCTAYLAPQLAMQLASACDDIQALTEFQLSIYRSSIGSLVVDEERNSAGATKGAAKKHMTEEEQWEAQIKKELAQKKQESGGANGGPPTLSAADQAKVKEQDEQRLELIDLVEHHYSRLLEGVRAIVLSDIEVGNACLPVFAQPVLRVTVAPCPAMEKLPALARQCTRLLSDLATAVYEIDEAHASTIAQALRIACRPRDPKSLEPHQQSADTNNSTVASLVTEPLPSPCPAAAAVFQQLDEYHMALSGASFVFLFPIFQACLMGPRTPPGCESCVSMLGLHTELLSGDEADKHVQAIRKDMVLSLMELLKHDRYQTFQHPSAMEVLVECYTAESLAAAELGPLLDQNGALGPKTCRIGAMLALNRIASEQPKLVKNNPLVENRIWVNCFAKDEEIRAAARQAFQTLKGGSAEELAAPSPVYAAPLTPLLNHSDESISEAAADAYANAMSFHPKSVGRNVENLCKLYIESYPNAGSGADETASVSSASSMAPAVVAAAPKPAKKPIATGLPKKKAGTKKSALSIAGIGKPKVGTKKKTSGVAAAALLKPKQERTLDQDELVSQFSSAPVKSKAEKDTPAKISVRLGILRVITSVTAVDAKVELDEDTLKTLTSFLMAYGLAESDEKVKTAARDTLRDVVAAKGGSEEAISFLLPQLEAILKTGKTDDASLKNIPTEKVPKDVAATDRRKEGAVVALGSVALHLKGPENESKIDNTVDMLLVALKTPSEDVQSSVADALTKLMKKGKTQERLETIVSDLLRDCLYGDSLGTRRGAAYGLAAAVKGSGIATLKKYDVVKKLEESCESGSASSKEGSLFAMELLSRRLGLLFEPYVIVLLPSLLKSFSDGSDYVRKAASDTAGLIMSKLSAHGVKLVMPAVLESFDESAWRTKQASIQMLGSMSHLAPKQLASALPKVVPKLTEAFSDTHPKVKESAQEALVEISTVIRNPEIKSVSAMLLRALTDPADNTQKALEGLIATEFLHAIDAPSLALIVPILHRGLRDRGATVKRMGGLIAGNICTMINDPRDFVPYLPILLPDLQTALLDPIPDVRNTSAKALGTLARSLGDHILPELRPWLVQKLREKQCSSAERSGAAQGLTEVLIASGTETVEEVMRSELLPLSSYPEASTREGVLWMLTFLPPAMGQNFTPFIDVSLGPLVRGLSDDSENVRDVALRAGRVLIRSHGKVHVDKILPSLEQGLEDDDHRIRQASLSLFGDLLSTIGGTSVLRGDGDTQDDIRKAERAQAQIALTLGPDTRKRVLSRLYMARNDTMHEVRHLAIQIWKTVVSVTARTLRDILPVLVNLIIDNLASGHDERTLVAGQCLGDVVSKLGESVLPQIIPVLRKSLYQGDDHTKRGVCVGLTEVIKGSSKEQIIRFLELIVKLVQDALSDDDAEVRSMASASFQGLYALVGSRAFDEIVPSLMVSLSKDDDETAQRHALNGLTGILAVRSRELLPYIIPRLISRPITGNHARALGRIASVTGSTISSHLSSIIPALVFELAGDDTEDEERIQNIRDCAKLVCGSVNDSGVNALVSEIASKCNSDKAPIRRESCLLFEVTITERAEKQDFLEEVPIILRELLYRLNDSDKDVLKATNAAFTALSKHVEAEELVKHIEFIRNLLASMVSDARRRKGGVGDGEFLLPGFNMPKGLDPLLPIYQRGILYGSPVIREVSASGMGEALNLTSSKFLAGPLIVKMTGPLLRIVGDRNPSNVKIAILKTLGLILVKGGPALRAFVPQFQTTFVKALSDPSRQVRIEAIKALSLLMPLSTRVDPLIKELVSGSLGKTLTVEGPAKAAVQTATLEALAQVLEKGGSKAKLPASIPSAVDAAKELVLESSEPTIRQAAAKALGAACTLLGAEPTKDLFHEMIIDDEADDENRRHGQACAIRRILAAPIGKDVSDIVPQLQSIVQERFWNDGNQSVREAALVAWGAVMGRASDAASRVKAGEGFILPILKDTQLPLEVHRAAATGLATALVLWEPSERVETLGVRILDACLALALQGVQRVQFAFNDVLCLALDVGSDNADNLEQYCNMTVFDNQRAVKALHSKVLAKTKQIALLD